MDRSFVRYRRPAADMTLMFLDAAQKAKIGRCLDAIGACAIARTHADGVLKGYSMVTYEVLKGYATE